MIDEAAVEQSEGWDWARVEIFGHTKHYGRVREEDKLGVKMLRIDVPKYDAPEVLRWETFWYSAAAIFSLARTDEESIMKANKSYESPYRHRLSAPEDKPVDGVDYETEDSEGF